MPMVSERMPTRPGLAGIRACVIGPDILHRQSLLAMFSTLSIEAASADDSHTFLSRDGGDRRGRVARAMDIAWGTRDPSWMRYVLDAIDASRADVLVFHWGTLPLADIVAIRRARPALRTMLMLLCFPLALSPAGIARQNLVLRRCLPGIDALICPTPEMAAYLERRVLGRHRTRVGVVAPCWPDAVRPTQRAEPGRSRPNLVYVGRTDLSGKTVHGADDIRELMGSLLDAGIELHHAYSPETEDGHPNRVQFKPLSNLQLMEGMSAFDASLVAYNLDACSRTDRFDLTVPDRLISSVLGGTPVALPRHGYAASKSYLRDHGALVTFSSADDLHRQLSDRSRMAELKDVAWEARNRFVAERQAGALGDLVGEVLEDAPGRRRTAGAWAGGRG
ncbi:glycosyltransferase [Luteimonas sp. MC1828]|uniref:glycosyltransferase n=1 Tax=Luteimonas sp. MC1828 TaxID=2799787 RepID=UPI0018F22325|nr:glycosyltransferase [Luteimonas sp. MC1828]MBJ7574519.1 glycosyltransferase [Luteimonas sp. MC1828]